MGGNLDLQRCVVSLEPHCATPSCRKAALELLAELMGDTPASLEEGVNMLLDLHFREQVSLTLEKIWHAHAYNACLCSLKMG